MFRSSSDRHLGCFTILTIVNRASRNMDEQELQQVHTQEEYNQMVFYIYFQLLKGYPHRFPKWLHQFSSPPAVNKCFPFSTSAPTYAVFNLGFLFVCMNSQQLKQYRQLFNMRPDKIQARRMEVGKKFQTQQSSYWQQIGITKKESVFFKVWPLMRGHISKSIWLVPNVHGLTKGGRQHCVGNERGKPKKGEARS